MRALRVLVGAAWLVAFLLAGDALADAAGLPLPGSVVGMVLLWGALEAGVVRLSWVRDGALTLLGLLGLLFVPAGVGFVAFAGAGWIWVGAAAVTGLGALVTIALTGVLVQRAMDRG